MAEVNREKDSQGARPILRPGATIAVLSPASSPRAELVERGVQHLRSMGYSVRLGAHALTKGPLYYAGRIDERLEDFHDAFRNPQVDAVLCTRGGWGSAELLPHLDAKLIGSNPKVFVGYSDHTALHMWLHRYTGITTYHGPMVAADFGRQDGVDLPSWNACLQGRSEWVLGAGDGLRVLRAGEAKGKLWGGCLSIVAESLGTPFAPQPTGGILFLEDINTKPFQWDRMVLHLKYAGMLEGVTGIVFGDMGQCVGPEEEELLVAALLHALRDFDGPIAMGLRSGHVSGANITLPLGATVRLDLRESENPVMHLDEAPFTDSFIG